MKKGPGFELEILNGFNKAYNFGKYDLRKPCPSVPGVDIVINSDLAEEVMLYAPECKRQERENISGWWKQCKANALQAGLIPVLFWRRNRMCAVAIIEEGHFHSIAMGIDEYKNVGFKQWPTKNDEHLVSFFSKQKTPLAMVPAWWFFELIDRLVIK